MSALVIVDVNPKDKEKMAAYSALAADTLVPYSGKFIAKGAIEVLHGESDFPTKVVIEFPDRNHAVKWYQSDAYQKIIPARDQGMDSQFHLVG